MNILQVFPHRYTSAYKGGGILEYVKNISERLAKKHDVTIFATCGEKDFPRFETINGVNVERFNRFSPNRAYFFSLQMLLRLRKVEFDVVHAHCYQAFPLHFSDLTKRRKLILSLHFHGVGHSSFRNSLIRFSKPIGERTVVRADKIIADSEWEKSLICKWFKINPSKIVIIPCGLSFSEFKGLKRQRHDFKSILYVGRLVDYKGAHYLVEVLPRLDDDVVLTVVGRGDLKHNLEKRAKRLNVLDRVKFFQNLPRRELLQKYVDADVYILLSQYEAYSMTVAEALTAGTPCIVANTTALAEWIDNKHCFGMDFPIDLDALAQLINKTIKIKDKFFQTKLKTEKILDWKEVVEKLECVYEDRENI